MTTTEPATPLTQAEVFQRMVNNTVESGQFADLEAMRAEWTPRAWQGYRDRLWHQAGLMIQRQAQAQAQEQESQ
jgi:hypothetical protein